VVRIFNLYVPTRLLVLLGGEIAAIYASFWLAIMVRFRAESAIVFYEERTIWKVLAIATLMLICSHYMELYDLQQLTSMREIYFRILTLLGTVCFLLAGLTYFFPWFSIGRGVFLLAICILSVTWMLWRWAYRRLISLPLIRERVYLLGHGARAARIADLIRTREELGMDVVGSAGEGGIDSLTRDSLGGIVLDAARRRGVKRVIVALDDRRSSMPLEELLELRMQGIRIDDGATLLERISGQIEVDNLRPSSLIFGDGFRLRPKHRLMRDLLSTVLALSLSILTLPLIPIVVLLIKLTSPGPALYRQKRVGFRNRVFHCYKFRTMRADAEADSGPTWACDDDPRVTLVGRFLRHTRLDEIPQLWNVLRGDMEFVGPRPERPEFVERLSQQIPYYRLRHVVRPGVTGWAQINYQYGNSVEGAKEKLKYDLFYIKNMSPGLDFWIVFQTVKTVLFGEGAL
jgi:sugar transferase (PEP-CTERM system associated)